MTTQEEQNFIAKSRNEFVLSAENAIKEIKDKFAEFHSQLDQRELELIQSIQKTQADVLQKFDETTPKLIEIQQCRDSTISILTNNSNKQLLETQLRSFTTEIDEVVKKTSIDKLISLKWKCELQVDNICQITSTKSSKRKCYPYSEDDYALQGTSLLSTAFINFQGKRMKPVQTKELIKPTFFYKSYDF